MPRTAGTESRIPPVDVLADGLDGGVMNGIQVRKGTIKAVIDNIKALESLSPESDEYKAIVDQIRELRPSIEALGLFTVFEPRDPAIAKLFAA